MKYTIYYYYFITSNFSGTIVAQTWQIAENFALIATLKTGCDFCIVFFFFLQKYMYDGPIYHVRDIDYHSVRIRIFLFRSRSLKEPWQFVVNYSRLRVLARSANPGFYIYGCATLWPVAFKRLILKGKRNCEH
jgi:hypothetical protein